MFNVKGDGIDQSTKMCTVPTSFEIGVLVHHLDFILSKGDSPKRSEWKHLQRYTKAGISGGWYSVSIGASASFCKVRVWVPETASFSASSRDTLGICSVLWRCFIAGWLG